MLKIQKTSDLPWKKIFHVTAWYTCFQEDNRYIFVPKENASIGLSYAIESAYNLSTLLRASEKCAVQLLIRIGKDAGQIIDWPYLELIKIKDTANEQY